MKGRPAATSISPPHNTHVHIPSSAPYKSRSMRDAGCKTPREGQDTTTCTKSTKPGQWPTQIAGTRQTISPRKEVLQQKARVTYPARLPTPETCFCIKLMANPQQGKVVPEGDKNALDTNWPLSKSFRTAFLAHPQLQKNTFRSKACASPPRHSIRAQEGDEGVELCFRGLLDMGNQSFNVPRKESRTPSCTKETFRQA